MENLICERIREMASIQISTDKIVDNETTMSESFRFLHFLVFCVILGGGGCLESDGTFWLQNCINRTSRSIKKKGELFCTKKKPLEACQIVIVYLLLTNRSSKAWSKYLLSRERPIVSY